MSGHKFKHHYLKNKRLILDFLYHFWNMHENFEKKMSIVAQLFQKLLTGKEVIT